MAQYCGKGLRGKPTFFRRVYLGRVEMATGKPAAVPAAYTTLSTEYPSTIGLFATPFAVGTRQARKLQAKLKKQVSPILLHLCASKAWCWAAMFAVPLLTFTFPPPHNQQAARAKGGKEARIAAGAHEFSGRQDQQKAAPTLLAEETETSEWAELTLLGGSPIRG
jgi:hypothetical protein